MELYSTQYYLLDYSLCFNRNQATILYYGNVLHKNLNAEKNEEYSFLRIFLFGIKTKFNVK